MIRIKHFGKTPDRICEGEAQAELVVGRLYLDQDKDCFLVIKREDKKELLWLKDTVEPHVPSYPLFPLTLAPDDIVVEITQGDNDDT